MASTPPKKYSAFISYRHLMPDMAIARALAKMLEHNMIRPHKGVRRNIRDVFVDVNELPLTESLDASIIHALENSEMLIVICSPNLPKSKYCMREISYFKELHGGRMDRIYTLLVDGDPIEAFPEILRTETQVILDENGVETTVTVPVEPLFADVRAKTVHQSLRKLRKTEYLRLAAAYYGCTYDDLYKRRQRWLWKMGMSIGSVAAATALGFGVYAYARNLQYSAVKAATYASYAREQNEKGDELLAIALCQEAWDEAVFSRSQRYMTALRSAAVQYDYKLRGAPFARLMTADYMNSKDFNFYVSNDETISLVHSNFIYQLTDTRTGLVLHKEPVDLVNVQKSDVSWYLTISAKADDQGVFHDTLDIWSLDDQQLIKSIVLRPTSLIPPRYELNMYTSRTVEHVLEVRDNGQVLALMDKQGNPVSREELLERAIIASQEEKPAAPPYRVATMKTGFGKSARTIYLLQNEAGDTLLELGEDVKHTALSPDNAYFACLAGSTLTVYDTAAWTVQGAHLIDYDNVTTLHLLADSTYVVVTHGCGEVINDAVLDWRTGSLLGEFNGRVIPGQQNSFYTVYDGKISSYHYNPFDLSSIPVIAAQKDQLLLTRQDDCITLLNGESNQVLLQADSVRPDYDIYNAVSDRVDCSDDLQRILIRQADGLTCYDQTGNQLWQTAPTEKPFALARDGSLAAFADDDGQVHVVSAKDGAMQYSITPADLPEGASLTALTVGKEGLCLCFHGAQYAGQTLWFPADSRKAEALGHYTSADLYPDGTLVLSASTYVQDFALWDARHRAFLLQPTENTGAWAYSPRTGYLVRHLQTSGNHNTLELEVQQHTQGRLIPCGRIPLSDVNLSGLYLDAKGEVLSFTAGDMTRIYRLKDLSSLLEAADCPLYYESGALYSQHMMDGELYTLPFLEGEALHAFASNLITTADGQRELSLAERSRYSFEE